MYEDCSRFEKGSPDISRCTRLLRTAHYVFGPLPDVSLAPEDLGQQLGMGMYSMF